MKTFSLVTLLSTALCTLASPENPRPEAISPIVFLETVTTTTVYSTSYVTVTQCGFAVTKCPVNEDATTSVVVTTIATMVCAEVSSTPSISSGLLDPTFVTLPLPSIPLETVSNPAISASNPFATTLEYTPTIAASGSGGAFDPAASPSLSSNGSASTDVLSGSAHPMIPIPVTSFALGDPSSTGYTYRTTVSFPVPSTGPSIPATNTDGTKISFPVHTGSSAAPVVTNTDGTTASFPVHSGSSSNFTATKTDGHNPSVSMSGASPSNYTATDINGITSSFNLSASMSNPVHTTVEPTLTQTSVKVTTSVPSHASLKPTNVYGSSVSYDNITTHVTSVHTSLWTSVVTVPLDHNRTSISTIIGTASDIAGITMSAGTGVSGIPSGSGSPYFSGGNGTVVSPKPTSSGVPMNNNSGQRVVGAGKSSIAAIVVALGFAHFA